MVDLIKQGNGEFDCADEDAAQADAVPAGPLKDSRRKPASTFSASAIEDR
jgi:hypothetical protein